MSEDSAHAAAEFGARTDDGAADLRDPGFVQEAEDAEADVSGGDPWVSGPEAGVVYKQVELAESVEGLPALFRAVIRGCGRGVRCGTVGAIRKLCHENWSR